MVRFGSLPNHRRRNPDGDRFFFCQAVSTARSDGKIGTCRSLPLFGDANAPMADLPLDVDLVGVEVDVIPLQRECLTWPEPGKRR
jgi:hypothetical protein